MMMGIVLATLGGLIIGSFLNVVAYRLPRGESLVTPASHCTRCGTGVKPYDNIPVLGWLMLHGRCRSCHEPIGVRYPVVEALSAALAVAVVLRKSGAHDLVLGLVLVGLLVPIALIDLDYQIIPNKITLPASLVAIAIGLLTRPGGVPEQLIAGAAAGGFLLLFALAYPKGMGMGDVKLAAVLGLYLGRTVAVAVFAGILAATLVGGVVMARVGVAAGRKKKVPLGPFLAAGGVFALLVGTPIVHWYLHSMA